MPTKIPSFKREQAVDPNRRLGLIRYFLYTLADFYEFHRFIKSQDAITVLDERDREWVREYYDKEAIVVRSGVDIPNLSEGKRPPFLGTDVRILSVGIFFAHRRFEDTIRAISFLDAFGIRASLSIIGATDTDPSYLKVIQSLIKELKLEDRVHILGSVDADVLLQAYKNADVFVFVSHLQSWGLAVFEALAVGLPVVVSKTSGASEVLHDGVDAFIVPPKNPEAIAKAIEKLAKHPDIVRSVVSAGKDVAKALSWGRYSLRMCDIFGQTMGVRE